MLATGARGAILEAELPFRLLTVGLYLAGGLLLAAVVIALVSRWRRRAGDECLTPTDQLAHFRSLYERGAISAEEFQQVRALLTSPTPRAVRDPETGAIRREAPDESRSPAEEPPQPPPNGVPRDG
jgi:hypothetical protein